MTMTLVSLYKYLIFKNIKSMCLFILDLNKWLLHLLKYPKKSFFIFLQSAYHIFLISFTGWDFNVKNTSKNVFKSE